MMRTMIRPAVLAALLAGFVVSAACAGLPGGGDAGPAPGFTVKLISGGEASLSQFRGRPLLLNFGASWCPHCIHELPALKAAYEKYGNDAGMLVILMKSKRGEVESLIKDHSLPFMVGFDPEGVTGKLYGVKGIPVTVFIDADGNIVDEYLGSISESSITRHMDAMLGR